MNARQKCKQLKKQAALYEDYCESALRMTELVYSVDKKIEQHEERQVTCMVEKYFDAPVEITDDIATEMMSRMEDLYDHFKQAVVFEGHTDPDTGEYILRAELTVVMPEFDEEEE